MSSYAADDDDLATPPPPPSAQRVLLVTDGWLVEREPSTLVVCSRRDLGAVHALLREPPVNDSYPLRWMTGGGVTTDIWRRASTRMCRLHVIAVTLALTSSSSSGPSRCGRAASGCTMSNSSARRRRSRPPLGYG